jgi:halogenation protein CepH
VPTESALEYDAVVVGGGPAGSTVATLVAMQGHRVLLLEKERFPRYQIGESLLPSTVHGVCRLLGVTEELERAGFVVKRGGSFRWGRNPEPWTFSFAISPKFAGEGATAYQVERMKFDQILLDNARAKGVEVRERCSVLDVVEEEDGRVGGVRFTDQDGVRHTVLSRHVVDASGHKSRIHPKVGGKRLYSEYFRNIALFGYFKGGKRLPPPNQGNILAAAFDSGWFWYIPLSAELTSVGVVLRHEELERAQGDRERALLDLIAECPLIAGYLADARLVDSGPYGEIRVRKDYSYSKESFWRPGMVLVGDAACFIDPVFSSGVHLATYSGLMAARSINSALRDPSAEQAAFEEYEARYRHEYGLFHDFLVAFYDMQQNEESYFWKAKRVTHHTATEIEAFVDLVGGGASGETALINASSYIERRQDDFRELTEMVERPVLAPGEDRDLLQSALVRSVVKAGAGIQVQAAMGENLDEVLPMREGGLVPSPDGMHWTPPVT